MPIRRPLFALANACKLHRARKNMPRSTTNDISGDNAQMANKLDVALGLRIRRRRKALKLSQTALAQGIGITFQQIQKYERGFNRVSFSRLVSIAHVLDCRVIDLIGDLDDAGLPSPLLRQRTAHLR